MTSNYNITYAAGAFSVTARPITVTANGSTIMYGDSVPTNIGATGNNFATGQSLHNATVVSNASSTSNVGTNYQTTASNAVIYNASNADVTSNYNITYATGAFSVTARPITVTANGSTMIYGDSVPTNLGATGNNFAAGQSLYSATVVPNANSASNVGSGYQTTASNAVIYNASNVDVTSNYDINYVAGAFSVTARPITVGTTGTSEYGNTIVTNGAAVVSGMGLVNGNTISSVNLATNANTMSNVASTYNTTASNAVFSNGDANNYSITYESNRPNSYVITPALLTITANDASKAAGTSNPVFTSSYSGFKNSQDESVLLTPVQYLTTATTGSPAGTYDIIPNNATAANYTILFVNGILTVTGNNNKPIPSPIVPNYPVVNQNPALYQNNLNQTIFEPIEGVSQQGKSVCSYNQTMQALECRSE